MNQFDPAELNRLYKPAKNSSGEDNGQVTIIGGSNLFHGAPLLSLKVASKIVDMVFFSSPEPSVGRTAEQIKSRLLSFIWAPWTDLEAYIKKSDAVLIGPGFMRFGSEKTLEDKREHFGHEEGKKSREITESLLKKFPNKKWVIDAGSLQTMDPNWIPKNAILTPNQKEFEILFGKTEPMEAARKYDCIIVLKGPTTMVCSPEKCVEISNGNAGLTKGGTGDVQAGLAIGLLAKNEPFLVACASSYLTKAAADELFKKAGTNYNADDLANTVPVVFSAKVA